MSFLQLKIYEGRLYKKSTLQKTSWEIFLCKYWLNFEFEKFLKMQEKTSREVFSVKHVSFVIDQNLSETWLFIEDFSENTSIEIFSMSQEVYLVYYCNWLYLTFQEKIFLEIFRRKTSIEVFSRNQRFDQNLKSNLRRLLKKSSH